MTSNTTMDHYLMISMLLFVCVVCLFVCLFVLLLLLLLLLVVVVVVVKEEEEEGGGGIIKFVKYKCSESLTFASTFMSCVSFLSLSFTCCISPTEATPSLDTPCTRHMDLRAMKLSSNNTTPINTLQGRRKKVYTGVYCRCEVRATQCSRKSRNNHVTIEVTFSLHQS